MSDCATGGWIAEHVFLALLGAIVVAQLPAALAGLRWLSSEAHSCGASPVAPADNAAAFASRYFRSTATGLWIYYRTWRASSASSSDRPRAVVYLLHGYAEH